MERSPPPPITSTAQDWTKAAGALRGYATFYDGYELSMPEVDCTVDYSDAYDCANAYGIILPEYRTWIRLNPDRTFTWWQPDNPIPGYVDVAGYPAELAYWHGETDITSGQTQIVPQGSVLACPYEGTRGDISLWGTLNGRLTIMAGREILVVGDLLLIDDPRVRPSNDRLGLLAGAAGASAADGNLVIPDMDLDGVDGDRLILGNYVGPHCNATLTVDRWNLRHREGILQIYGSVFQGRLRPTENADGSTGYALDLVLDPRNCESPPSCFPTLEWGH